MKCPKCGYRIRIKTASEIGRKGGSVSSEKKKQAALDREKRRRERSNANL